MINKASKNKEIKNSIKKIEPLSKTELETIIGGPETSRGTVTDVGR